MTKIFLMPFFVSVSMIGATAAHAGDVRVVCPYVGTINDVCKDESNGIRLKDNSLLKGVFFLWVNPKRYQWNIFIYQSANINYSTLWGGHFIFDYYFKANDRGKYVAGIGAECLLIDMNAGNHLVPLKDFTMNNNVLAPYARFGYRFQLNHGSVDCAVLPWVGAEYQKVWGTLSFVPPGPPMGLGPPIHFNQDIHDESGYAMAGLNVNATFFHAFEVEGKYYGAFNRHTYLSDASSLVNFYLTKHWGLSYRLKYMETTQGRDLYNIFGIAFMF